jgi:hypothetical protein
MKKVPTIQSAGAQRRTRKLCLSLNRLIASFLDHSARSAVELLCRKGVSMRMRVGELHMQAFETNKLACRSN